MWFVEPANLTANLLALDAYALESTGLRAYSLASHLPFLLGIGIAVRYARPPLFWLFVCASPPAGTATYWSPRW